MSRPADREPSLRVGIFGGSFDPPHVGHVTVASDVADALALDLLIWVPAGRPPHKRDRALTDGDIRLEMLRAAIHGHPRFEVDDMELRRPGPSYTTDTVRQVADHYPDSEIFLVLGADQLQTFVDGWRNPEEILRRARLAAMDRDGASTRDVPVLLPGMERSVHVPVTRVDVSSSVIRERIWAGEDIQGLVPPGVAEIIRREGLYRG